MRTLNQRRSWSGGPLLRDFSSGYQSEKRKIAFPFGSGMWKSRGVAILEVYARAAFEDDRVAERKVGSAMSGEDFETLLREDLPRGLREQEKSGGRERGLFARWLTPAEMSGKQWNP